MIETKRLILTTATRGEMERMIAAEQNSELKKAYREMLQGCLQHPDQWDWYAVWLIDRKDGAHVGDLSFKGLNPDGSAEIGYGIDPAFWGQGYATEAVGAAVDWAFAQQGVTKIEAETDPENVASQRVLAKCGFAATGTSGEEGPRFERKRT